MRFAIVILEVNDMNIDDNRPGMPGFYENTNPGDTRYKNVALVSAEQNYEYVRSQSVGGERIHASVSRRQVTPSVLERVKGAIFQFVDIAQYCVTEVLHQPLRAVAVAGILAALGLGANAINQEVIQPSVIEYQAYSNDVNQQIEQIINQSKYRTNDGTGWALRTDEVATNLQELIQDGTSPFMVYSSYVTNLSNDYLEDERDYISNHLFGMETDDIAKELGYDSSDNLELRNAMQQSLAQNGTNMETLHADMVLNDLYQNHLSDTKGYGGM